MVCMHDSFQFLELLAGVNVFAYCAIALPQLPVVGTFVAACNFAAFAVMALLSLDSDWVPTEALALVSLLVIFILCFYAILDSGGAVVSSLLGGLLSGDREAYAYLPQSSAVFPDAENLQKMVSPASFSNEARESMSNVFTSFKKGK